MNRQKWIQMVSSIGLMALAYTPLAPMAPYVAQSIQDAELLPGASGADKLSHVVSLVRNGIAAANAQAGRQVIDTQLSDTLIQQAISTAVSVVNIVHQAHAADVPTLPNVAVVQTDSSKA